MRLVENRAPRETASRLLRVTGKLAILRNRASLSRGVLERLYNRVCFRVVVWSWRATGKQGVIRANRLKSVCRSSPSGGRAYREVVQSWVRRDFSRSSRTPGGRKGAQARNGNAGQRLGRHHEDPHADQAAEHVPRSASERRLYADGVRDLDPSGLLQQGRPGGDADHAAGPSQRRWGMRNLHL